jgi:hypothetical protein
MKNLSPVNVENLESILERIWSGDLEHNQQHYNCGTAYCLAGWDVVLNATKTPDSSCEDSHESLINICLQDGFNCPWRWSKSFNNLTDVEAKLLYSVNTTKGIQKLTIKALKEGRRLTSLESSFSLEYAESYHADSIDVASYHRTPLGTLECLAALCTFLGPVKLQKSKNQEYYTIKLFEV